VAYARSLARLERLRQEWPVLAVCSTDGSLLERVKRLVGRTPAGRGESRFAGACFALLALAVLLVAPIESARATHALKESAGLPGRVLEIRVAPVLRRVGALSVTEQSRSVAPPRVRKKVREAGRRGSAPVEAVFPEAQAAPRFGAPVRAPQRNDWTIWPGR
jgi:hypothetical protein